ncbi:MAG: DUF4260 domain-containing protein [Chryseolinea sp.]
MKYLLRLEEATKFAITIYLSMQLGYGPLIYFAFLLVPDVSMVGYLINSRTGAYIYNVVHHQSVALIVSLTGYILNQPHVTFAGLILLGHSSMDRMLGYGLKYNDDFKNTHLGWIGKQSEAKV